MRTIALIIAALAFGGSASAADMAPRMPVKAPVAAPTNSWTGFYIGGTAGGAWGSFDPTTSVTFDPANYFNASIVSAVNAAGLQSINPSDFTGGLEWGYNFRSGPVVWGIEGDFEYMHLGGSAQSTAAYPCCAPAAFTISSTASTDWLATVRGRLGYAANNWLFYATGGAAFTTLKGNFSVTDDCAAIFACGEGVQINNLAEAAALSSTRIGYVVGGGIETGLSANWTLKAEYLYVCFGTASTSGTGVLNATVAPFVELQPIAHSIDLKANIARVGLNYRFN